MPGLPLKPCKSPGCNGLVRSGFCPKCTSKGKAREIRPSSYQRGYNRKGWLVYRDVFLSRNPWCMDPYQIHNLREPASCVDHIASVKQAPERYWDTTNHQSLCQRCHSKKTAMEDGGFGRARKVGPMNDPKMLYFQRDRGE